ncbi:MAG: BadF/BadG/BcrA/BcrD ATPase family protein [Acholeplasmataceae bacterium]|jgi:N-acetylglucosamine kinase-like BadF-type ATPase|nr:BadF/BadG/BcrA/BcrD ATPase family protein [Acholeplasmataceae bacterium]
MRNLVIGIDGGGTKTLGVLFNDAGEELLRTEFGFSNFSIDEDIAITNINKTIEALLTQREPNDNIMVIMGISGASKLTNKTSFLEALEKTYDVKAELVTDAHIAIHSIDKNPDESVIMAISGTGSAVMMLENDTYHLIGGYGYLLGDEGSAYHLVIQALKLVTQAFDTQHGWTPLVNKILSFMKVDQREQFVNYVYKLRKTELALLAKIISEAALESDEQAHQLLCNEGKLLAHQVMIAEKRLKVKTKVRIAVRGGFVVNAPYVREAFISELKKHIEYYTIEENPNEAVLGAYRLGIKKLSEVTSC